MPVFGGVLTEGGQHDAVLESQTPDFERLEEFWNGLVIWLWVRSRPRWRVLGGCEVGDLDLLEM